MLRFSSPCGSPTHHTLSRFTRASKHVSTMRPSHLGSINLKNIHAHYMPPHTRMQKLRPSTTPHCFHFCVIGGALPYEFASTDGCPCAMIMLCIVFCLHASSPPLLYLLLPVLTTCYRTTKRRSDDQSLSNLPLFYVCFTRLLASHRFSFCLQSWRM